MSGPQTYQDVMASMAATESQSILDIAACKWPEGFRIMADEIKRLEARVAELERRLADK